MLTKIDFTEDRAPVQVYHSEEPLPAPEGVEEQEIPMVVIRQDMTVGEVLEQLSQYDATLAIDWGNNMIEEIIHDQVQQLRRAAKMRIEQGDPNIMSDGVRYNEHGEPDENGNMLTIAERDRAREQSKLLRDADSEEAE